MKKLLFLLSFLLLIPIASATTNSKCLDNAAFQINTTTNITSGGSLSTIDTSEIQICGQGCSYMLNSCRPTIVMQTLYITGITGAFIFLMLISEYLTEWIPVLDVIICVMLGIFCAVFGLTDVFSSNLGYIFYGESVFFIVMTMILAYRYTYKG